MTSFVWRIVLCSLLAAPLAADVVHLRDGRRLEGSVTDNGATLTVKMRLGSLVVKKADVLRIERRRAPAEVYRERRAALAPRDVAGRLALAAWCKGKGLQPQARALYEEVVALDPDNATAHAALGHVRRDGRWMTEDEAKRAAGLVKHNGRWVFPEEKRLAERQAYLDGARIAAVELLDERRARIHLQHPKLGPKTVPGLIRRLVRPGVVRVEGEGWPVYTEIALEGRPTLLVAALRRRLEPADGAHRLELARWLALQGHPEEAARDAAEAARLDPRLAEQSRALTDSLVAARLQTRLAGLRADWARGAAEEALAGLRALLEAGPGPVEKQARALLARWETGLVARRRVLARLAALEADAPSRAFLDRLRRGLVPELVALLDGREIGDVAALRVLLAYRDAPAVLALPAARVLALEAWLERYRATEDAGARRNLARRLLREFPGLEPAVLANVLRRIRRPATDPAAGRSRHDLLIAEDGSRTTFELYLPRRYTPFLRWPLLVDNHGKGGSGAEPLPRWTELAERHGLIVACPTGTTFRDKGWGGTAVERSITLSTVAAVRRLLSIDPARIHLAGSSMGGHAAWDIALHHPDRFAAIFPTIGGARIKHYRLLPGLRHTAVFDAQGALDDPLLVAGVRYCMKRLAGLGYRTHYEEAPALGHRRVPGSEAAFIAWAAKLRKPHYPRQVTLRAADARHAKSYWIEVIAHDRAALDPKKPLLIPGFNKLPRADRRRVVIEAYEKKVLAVEGRIDGNRIELEAGPLVHAVRLFLAPELVDLARPVQVVARGKTLFDGRVPVSLSWMLEQWRAAPDRPEVHTAALELRLPR